MKTDIEKITEKEMERIREEYPHIKTNTEVSIVFLSLQIQKLRNDLDVVINKMGGVDEQE